jgi:uncharacterized membrane protein YdjX (TVP38/TMEM64 family)
MPSCPYAHALTIVLRCIHYHLVMILYLFFILVFFVCFILVCVGTGDKRWVAIDKAIAKEGFKVVLLLRLSPLLPFALSNYLYALTSVDFA